MPSYRPRFLFKEQNHGNTGNIEQQLHLELWKGNLGGALQTCKERGELNEMIVAMSPLGNCFNLLFF